MVEAKSFMITKREVWEAYKRVKASRGAAGCDGVTISEFERDLSKNLYRIWNRMSSGSYFPPTAALLDRLTHHCHIVETGNESHRFLHSTAVAKKRIKGREQARQSVEKQVPLDAV